MTIVSTGGRGGALPEPDRHLDRREPQIALGDLTGLILVRGRDRRQIRPAAAPPSAPSTLIDWSQPIRSAITVAGILG